MSNSLRFTGTFYNVSRLGIGVANSKLGEIANQHGVRIAGSDNKPDRPGDISSQDFVIEGYDPENVKQADEAVLQLLKELEKQGFQKGYRYTPQQHHDEIMGCSDTGMLEAAKSRFSFDPLFRKPSELRHALNRLIDQWGIPEQWRVEAEIEKMAPAEHQERVKERVQAALAAGRVPQDYLA